MSNEEIVATSKTIDSLYGMSRKELLQALREAWASYHKARKGDVSGNSPEYYANTAYLISLEITRRCGIQAEADATSYRMGAVWAVALSLLVATGFVFSVLGRDDIVLLCNYATFCLWFVGFSQIVLYLVRTRNDRNGTH